MRCKSSDCDREAHDPRSNAKSKDQFFLVWSPELGSPACRHSSFASAKTEAKRMAAQNRGERFYVLNTIGNALVSNDSWTLSNEGFYECDEELPF